MNEKELWLTALFNDHLAGPANSVLGLFHMTAANPARPWENWIVVELVVVALLVIAAAVLRSSLSVENPGVLQHIFEFIWGQVKGTLDGMGVHHGEQYAPYISTIFIFIFSMNMIGIIPAFSSPTMTPAVPVGLAVITFLYFNLAGFQVHGIKYLGQFAGPVRFPNPIANFVIIVFMLPIEIISVCVRPLSLSVRLYGNMFAGEQVTGVFLDLTKLVIPVIFMGLHVFVALVQAYVFTLLTAIYISFAVAEEH